MELDENLERKNNIEKTWESHINEKLQESLKKAIKHRDGAKEEIEIEDMGAIDSIEDEIVKCEILNGDMLEIPQDKFKYNIEEGDIINLKLTYKEGNLIHIDVLDKNEEEKRIRIKMIQEKINKIRK